MSTNQENAAKLRAIADDLESGDTSSSAGEQAAAPPAQVSAPTSPVPGTAAHVVQADDSGQAPTLDAIAEQLDVSADALRSYNAGHLPSSPTVEPGTVLAVPPAEAAEQVDQAAAATATEDTEPEASGTAEAAAPPSTEDTEAEPTAGAVVTGEEDENSGNP